VIRCGELYREQDNYFKDGFRYVFVPLHKKTKTTFFQSKFVIVFLFVKVSIKNEDSFSFQNKRIYVSSIVKEFF
jgi:hypothetical protein